MCKPTGLRVSCSEKAVGAQVQEPCQSLYNGEEKKKGGGAERGGGLNWAIFN